MQTDPIGYLGGPNLYAYVGNDPVNLVDPLGLQGCGGDNEPECPPIVVTGKRLPQPALNDFILVIYSSGIFRSVFGLLLSGGHHDYTVESTVAEAEQCTAEQIDAALSLFSVPGHEGSNPLTSTPSERFVYWDPRIGRMNLGLPVPGGWVDAVRLGPLAYRNTTQAAHVFCCGTVTRTARLSNGSWMVTTVGTGSNASVILAAANEVAGREMFEELDDALREYLEENC